MRDGGTPPNTVHIDGARQGLRIGAKAEGIYGRGKKDAFGAYTLIERFDTLAVIKDDEVKVFEHTKVTIVVVHLRNPELVYETYCFPAFLSPVPQGVDAEKVCRVTTNSKEEVIVGIDRAGRDPRIQLYRGLIRKPLGVVVTPRGITEMGGQNFN